MSQHIFSKSELIFLETTVSKMGDEWTKDILPILEKEAETWERVLKAFWEIDQQTETDARAREVVKRHISHLKRHISEMEAEA
jgi:hypothetical protein